MLEKNTRKRYASCEGVTLAYAGGTSNLFNYLKAKHPITYTKAVLKECSTQKQTTLGTFATACPPARANRITTLNAEFVARDLRPTSTVDGKGFQQLLRFVEPGYKISSRPYLTATCRRLYSSLKEHLLETLASRNVGITTDLWTSKATEGYPTVTAHFICLHVRTLNLNAVRDRLSSHSSMRLRHKTSHGSSPCANFYLTHPFRTYR